MLLLNLFTVYMSGENISADFEKVNPFKQVPVIDDDGFKLSERLKSCYQCLIRINQSIN